MKDIAFIFARGGSKGLPRKNIKLLNGIPLISYSVNLAKNIKSVEKVFVSTEDSEIASIAEAYGAEIIERPKHLAEDSSPEWLSWQHAVQYVINNYGDFDRFISLPCTSPLRTVEDVENGLLKYSESNADICIALTKSSKNPYFNMVFSGDDELYFRVMSLDKGVDRRQDAPEIFDICGSVYITTPSYILNGDGVMSGRVTGFEVPKYRAIDIDDIYDFYFAEAIIKNEAYNKGD